MMILSFKSTLTTLTRNLLQVKNNVYYRSYKHWVVKLQNYGTSLRDQLVCS